MVLLNNLLTIFVKGHRELCAIRAYIWKKKRLLMDQDAIMRAIRRISHEILERNKGLSNALIVGIERRGVILAKRLQAEIERIEGIRIECESLNVAMYRDDRDARQKRGNHVRLIQRRKQSSSWMM